MVSQASEVTNTLYGSCRLSAPAMAGGPDGDDCVGTDGGGGTDEESAGGNSDACWVRLPRALRGLRTRFGFPTTPSSPNCTTGSGTCTGTAGT